MSLQLMAIVPNGNKIMFKDTAASINSLNICNFRNNII